MSSRPVNKSAYELLREDNIREREAMFESLNIEQDVTFVKKDCQPRLVEGVEALRGKQ